MLGLCLAWLLGACQRAPSTLLNPDFERLTLGGVPAGWVFGQPDSNPFLFQSAPGSAGNGGHLFRASGDGPGWATLYQSVDAAPFRGARVRLSARIKVARPGTRVALSLAVKRPEPKPAGFYYGMDDRPIGAGDWTRYEIVGRVAPEATTIWLALNVAGDADVTIDEVALERVVPDSAPPSPEAAAYLDRAIELTRRLHIDSANADWNRIAADARADIGGARTTRDTYDAIRGMLGALGEKHSFLRPPPSAATPGGKPLGGVAAAAVSKSDLPTWELIDKRYAMVRLPGLDTFGPGGTERGSAYRAAIREGLQTMDAQPICGWLVDLRSNTGGNMWPMLGGLDPLLGAAPFGAFVDPAGKVEWWQRRGGGLTSMPVRSAPEPPAYALSHAAAPVAVLLGPRTSSSGEMTAAALIGRADVRTFGDPSAGYTTGNQSLPLSDGAVLVLTSVYIRDRTGKHYQGPIQPNVKTPGRDAQAEAIRWLEAQCG